MEIGNKTPKYNWKVKILSVILIGLLYGGIMSLIDYWTDGGFKSTIGYVIQGAFFGIFMGLGFPYFLKIFGTKFLGKNIKPLLLSDELVEIEGPANLFRGMEAVGGKLFLTNKKIIFKSHNINIQNGQTDIGYSDISGIIKRKTTKLINNGMKIKTTDGQEFDFVVNEREKWIQELNERIN